MTALLAAFSLIFGGGLRADLPDDSTTTLIGVDLDLRCSPLQGLTLGARAGWGGGADTTNPERVRLSQRIEIVVVSGARRSIVGALDGIVELQAGALRADGFPSGRPHRVREWGPTAGALIGVTWWAVEAWGHPTGVELRGGASYARLDDRDVYLPFAGLSFVGVLDEPRAAVGAMSLPTNSGPSAVPGCRSRPRREDAGIPGVFEGFPTQTSAGRTVLREAERFRGEAPKGPPP